ncbi:MAG: hypothetical protein P8Y02_15530, partial [Deinococcales bacterium]
GLAPVPVARARTAVDDAYALLDAELAAWRDAAATPATSPSACRALRARENAVYGAWLDVIGATFDYLEKVDGSWRGAALTETAPTAAPGRTWPVRPGTCAGRVG